MAPPQRITQPQTSVASTLRKPALDDLISKCGYILRVGMSLPGHVSAKGGVLSKSIYVTGRKNGVQSLGSVKLGMGSTLPKKS